MPNDPFVDIAALPSLGPVHYLDARYRAMFDAGHAPGAVCVPVEEWDAAAKAADTGFSKTTYWDGALGSLGVDHSAIAVAYDSGRMTDAARVWFVLQYFGVEAVILNGGWPVLSSATGLPAGTRPSTGGFRAVPAQGRLVWSIGRPSSVNFMATRMCSTPARAQSSLERTCATVPAAGISRVPGICRIPICWKMALFVRHRRCEPCWSGWDSAQAITS